MMRAKSRERQQGLVVGDDTLDVVDAVAANQTFARARKAAAVAPFSSASGSV
jgi:hypothetical protein